MVARSGYILIEDLKEGEKDEKRCQCKSDPNVPVCTKHPSILVAFIADDGPNRRYIEKYADAFSHQSSCLIVGYMSERRHNDADKGCNPEKNDERITQKVDDVLWHLSLLFL